MRQATDEQLWAHAAAGAPDAFGELYERHARAVYNYCFRRTANWALAEDLTSVVFLEAWRKREAVAFEGASLRPWLLGVATNVLRTRWRSQRRHRAALARLPLERGGAFADDAHARVDDERRMRAALRLLERLPKREQETFALCELADLTYAEVAVALGLPVGTVRSRLSRARARLRTLVDDESDRAGEALPAQEVSRT
jgi:RNA polymerase sigma factor (sigma-70 family)